jgi:hypothetical protein
MCQSLVALLELFVLFMNKILSPAPSKPLSALPEHLNVTLALTMGCMANFVAVAELVMIDEF